MKWPDFSGFDGAVLLWGIIAVAAGACLIAVGLGLLL